MDRLTEHITAHTTGTGHLPEEVVSHEAEADEIHDAMDARTQRDSGRVRKVREALDHVRTTANIPSRQAEATLLDAFKLAAFVHDEDLRTETLHAVIDCCLAQNRIELVWDAAALISREDVRAELFRYIEDHLAH